MQKIFSLLLLVFVVSCFANEPININTNQVQIESTCKQTIASNVDEIERSGCCSWHGGVCDCSGGRVKCCDGTFSPTCTCKGGDIKQDNGVSKL